MTLIPAMLGAAVVVLGAIALADGMRKHAMHGAAALALLGVVGGIGPLAMGGTSRFHDASAKRHRNSRRAVEFVSRSRPSMTLRYGAPADARSHGENSMRDSRTAIQSAPSARYPRHHHRQTVAHQDAFVASLGVLVSTALMACFPDVEVDSGNDALNDALRTGSAEATLSIQNDWGSGYCAEVVIANLGTTAVASWEVTLDLKDSPVTDVWNGAQAGDVFRPLEHNQRIAPQDSVSFGFCATGNGRATVAAVAFDPGEDEGDEAPDEPSCDDGQQNQGEAGVDCGGPCPACAAEGEWCDGYATRYWDCCKPHCGWPPNTSTSPANICGESNEPLSDANTASACDGGGAFQCHNYVPRAVDDTLAHGYAATSSGDVCGRCFELEFTGQGRFGADPGSAAIAGKTMIVQALNIGFDVAGGQFDLLIPGGGVGAFNACSRQWGVSTAELGAQFGGFLTACQQQLGFNASRSAYKSCVRSRCSDVFGSRGLTELETGCDWFVDWFEAADNPNIRYREVGCPAELQDISSMTRSGGVAGGCGG